MDPPEINSKPNNIEDTLHGMYRFDRPQVDKPEVDIVLVPGLGTDPVKCWEHCKPVKPGRASRDGEQVTFNWVTDSKGLSSIASSKARILCFAYASAWRGRLKIETNFSNLATELCESLKSTRKEADEKWRPIILIGHSMGGVVIAEALNELHRRRDHYGDVVSSVTACFFFGVPFSGSEMAKKVLNYAPSAKFHTDILSIMWPTPGNARLQKLCGDFKQLAALIYPTIDLHCFYESVDLEYGKAFASMPFLGGAVTSTLNATWGKQTSCRTRARPSSSIDHSGLVKFPEDVDGDYDSVRQKLSKSIREAPSLAKKRQGASRETSMSSTALYDLKRRLASLLSHKLETTPARFNQTSWFLQEEEYMSWERLSPRGLSCLWLVGKPGVGRTSIVLSALAKLGGSNEEKIRENKHQIPLIASFFCESTTAGTSPVILLKALLLQLLDQNPLTADHAKSFLLRNQESTKQAKESLVNETNAVMSIYNLWNCVDRILRDEAFSHAYIIINNVHLLAPGLQTSLLIEQIHDHFLETKTSNSESRRWLFTCLDGDDQKRFGQLMRAGCSQIVDLSADKFKKKVSSSLENHVTTQVGKLRQSKKYSRDQVYMIQDLMKSRPPNKHWIDIQYIRLKALADGSSMEAITEILHPATAIDLRNLKRTCWLTIFENNPKDSHSLKDLLSALALAFRPPTIDELAVLCGIRDPARVRTLVERCNPMIQLVSLSNNTQGLEFSNPSLKVDFLWESDEGLNAEAEANPQIQRIHGLLAWRCFSAMEATQNMPCPTTVKGESGTANPASDPSDEGTTVVTATDYHWEFWMNHALQGKRGLAEDLVRELPSFWQERSPLRERWLASHPLHSPSSDRVISHVGMTALHAAAMFGYDSLVQQLIHHGHKRELGMFNGNGYTPLHIAAMCNHEPTIQALLLAMNDVHIDVGNEETGTALHAAATQGHIEAMKRLLDNDADPNAFCARFGPVINAAIRSGNNDAVQFLLHHSRHSLTSHGARTEPPLALAAAMSKKEVFEKILVEGKTKWTRGDYEVALDKACFTEKKDSVDVLLKKAREHLDDDTLRKCMLVAAVEKNWTCVEMIAKAKPGLAGDEIFYLAAVTTREGDARQIADRVLVETWQTAQTPISPKVLSAALYQAADNEKHGTVRWILDVCKVDPNKAIATFREQGILPDVCFKNDPGQRYGNALTAAAWDGTVPIVKTLIDFGAKVDTDDGCPLQNAAQRGHAEVVRTLLEAGADINRIPEIAAEPNYRGPDFTDGTALHAACRAGNTDVVKILLEHDIPANPNLGRGLYQRPILAATKLNKPQILKLLLKSKVDVKVCGAGDMSTPLISAAFGMSAEAVESLIEAGADVNQVDNNHDTAIILAARAGKVDTLRLLIDKKADLLYENPRKESALTAAARQDHLECFSILADAVAPLFRTLKKVARENSTMKALLRQPEGEHKFYDEETIRPLEAKLEEAVQTIKRTEEIRAERKMMEEVVDSAKKETASYKQNMETLRKDWHEYRERTDQHQKNYDASIEGFTSVKSLRDRLLQELEMTRSELARSREECAAARTTAEDARKEAAEEKQKHGRTLELHSASRAAQDKEIKALKDEMRASIRDSDSESLGTWEQDGRSPRPVAGKRDTSRFSSIFKRSGGD